MAGGVQTMVMPQMTRRILSHKLLCIGNLHVGKSIRARCIKDKRIALNGKHEFRVKAFLPSQINGIVVHISC